VTAWVIAPGCDPVAHPIPEDGRGDLVADGITLHPGDPNPNDDWARGAIVAALARIVPWARIVIAPAVRRDGRQVQGVAVAGNAVISGARYTPNQLDTAYHEAWHLLEAELCAEALAPLDAALAHGQPWPGDYLPRHVERRARAFAALALAADEGLPIHGTCPATDLLVRGYTGQLAEQIQAEWRAATQPHRTARGWSCWRGIVGWRRDA